MIYEVMKHIRNFFSKPEYAITKNFIIVNGEISLPFDAGQYFIVEDSKFNDYKVFKYGVDTLKDETFTGIITPLYPPESFITLCDEIAKWCADNNNPSAYVSESFGGYSYTKGTTASGRPFGWQEAYADKLNIWRKI